MSDFSKYTDASLSALLYSLKFDEIVAKKQALLEGVYDFHNFVPSTILFIGFNPAILACKNQNIFVTNISDAALQFLNDKQVKYTYVALTDLPTKTFDVVVAMDEYFTYASNAEDQQNTVTTICKLAREFVISTLRDYKNQDFRDREFSIPAVVRNSDRSVVYTEFHDWNINNKTQWDSKVYEVNNSNDSLTVYGKFKRHTMYFKQLAKFSIDSGASDFTVHKNLMYKSLIKRNYEHVVSIRF